MKKLNISSQITWVYTDNLEHTSKFYEKDLELELVIDEGAARIFQVSSTAQIGVCVAFEDRVVDPKGGMITLVTNDVDGWFDRLTKKGIVINRAPHKLEQFNIYTFFLEDPNGYVIEIQQFL
jgi:predicted enzyme related to lactoylglutathione lyase